MSVFLIAAIALGLLFRSWSVIFVAAAFSLGLSCLAMLVLGRSSFRDLGNDAISLYILCFFGIILAVISVVVGGCSLLFEH